MKQSENLGLDWFDDAKISVEKNAYEKNYRISRVAFFF